MRLDDKIWLQKATISYDEELNAHEQTKTTYLGKCVIVQNSSATQVKSNDGSMYTYSYIVYLRKPKEMENIPFENDIVHIIKKDGTIDTKKKVVGFRTLRNWLQLWL